MLEPAMPEVSPLTDEWVQIFQNLSVGKHESRTVVQMEVENYQVLFASKEKKTNRLHIKLNFIKPRFGCRYFAINNPKKYRLEFQPDSFDKLVKLVASVKVSDGKTWSEKWQNFCINGRNASRSGSANIILHSPKPEDIPLEPSPNREGSPDQLQSPELGPSASEPDGSGLAPSSKQSLKRALSFEEERTSKKPRMDSPVRDSNELETLALSASELAPDHTSTLWVLNRALGKAEEVRFPFLTVRGISVSQDDDQILVVDQSVGLIKFSLSDVRWLETKSSALFKPCYASGVCTILQSVFVTLSNSNCLWAQGRFYESPKFAYPTGIVVASALENSMYVGCLNSVVRVVRSELEDMARACTELFHIDDPKAFCVDLAFDKINEKLFLLDSGNQSIWLYHNLELQQLKLHLEFSHPQGIFAQSKKSDTILYVSDTGNRRIVQIGINSSNQIFACEVILETKEYPMKLGVGLDGQRVVFSSVADIYAQPESVLFLDNIPSFLERLRDQVASSDDDPALAAGCRLGGKVLRYLMSLSTFPAVYQQRAVSKVLQLFRAVESHCPECQAKIPYLTPLLKKVLSASICCDKSL